MVVIGVVVAIVVEVVVVLVVTFDQPHFQQLPYILSNVITLKSEPDNGPLNWAVLRLAVKQLLPSETSFFGEGRRERRMFEVILEAAPVQTVAVTELSSSSICRSRTVNVKDLLPLLFLFFFFTAVNECHPDVKGNCSHLCVNRQGRYYCKCPNGFQMSQDNKTCKCPKGFQESVNGTICLGK